MSGITGESRHTVEMNDAVNQTLREWESECRQIAAYYSEIEGLAAFRTFASCLMYLLAADRLWVSEGMVMGTIGSGRLTFGMVRHVVHRPESPLTPALVQFSINS